MSMSSSSRAAAPRGGVRASGGILDFLTLDRLMTGPLIHLIYWAGLGMFAVLGFGAVGAAAGVALREGEVMGVLLSLVTLVMGLLALTAAALIWRGFCEFYVAVFQISEDLRALRRLQEEEASRSQQ
jgi:hypothetical protein